jgi:uncharacterized protein (TIGR02145 family)
MTNKTLTTFIMFLIGVSGVFGQEIVTDIDGNQYNTVQIGEQVWLKENLKVTRYNNGDQIMEMLNPEYWLWQADFNTTTNPFGYGTPGHCYYNNDTMFLNRYGRLYNWFVAGDNRNVCPTGWKVPSYNDYYEMFSYIDSTTLDLLEYSQYYINDGVMNDKSGKKFSSNLYWDQGYGGNNQTGFTALPNGERSHYSWTFTLENTKYLYEGVMAYFWTKDTVSWDMDGGFGVRSKSIHIIGDYIRMYPSGRSNGYGIRCIKDSSNGFYEEIKVEPSIYPNPTNENVTFVSDDSFSGQTYEVYEINGQLIRSGEISSTQQIINISDQPTGVYMMRVKDKVFKIVKN